MNRLRYLLLSLLMAMVALSSCRKEEEVIPSTKVRVGAPGRPGKIKGFFLLNEANMGSNKATLDYYDYTTAFYTPQHLRRA